ncbi:YrhK family protein [Flammeovirga sp. OC4]|uniref:YrhK family protein n=1 Tax=Flammeovirga sp. OC4 TaxID=1382345 RepID=UPI0012E01FC3|nr:YrhK family protein [Flammeovirga sp. OC4]
MHIHLHPLTSRRMVLWMSILFMVGASCFIYSSFTFLLPHPNESFLNIIFFIGSIPFTFAAFFQLLNATNQKNQEWKLMAFRPKNSGYIAGLTQWLGTLLFNINTFDATRKLDWLEGDLLVWVPNMLGSILFLISAFYLLKEISFKLNWDDRENLSIWINMLGCITFMISAIASIYLPQPLPLAFVQFALVNTGIGAICFFLAAFIGLTRLPE